jgi:nucleoside-diphosphate-sugar epimerase
VPVPEMESEGCTRGGGRPGKIREMRSLVIGGTRNLGPSMVRALLQHGYEVAVFNRGQTPDDLPQAVERLRGDRTDREHLKQALGGREFDLVIDTTLYNSAEAEAIVELFAGRVGRYLFLSTGQVYLVRLGLARPFKEEDYAGPVMNEPEKTATSDHANWVYGFEKRAAEDVFAHAWEQQKFPFTSLRLPIVNSERDHYDRLYGYFLRVQDGGPILVPEEDGPPLRHVYGEDVTQAVLRLAATDLGKGRAYNIGQDETHSLGPFLELLAEAMQRPLKIARVQRAELEREGLLPDCSPFSGRWMSALENARSKQELGMSYTPVRAYLKKLVDYFQAAPARKIEGYLQREKELKAAASPSLRQD